jgi:hypothetical protein
VLLIEPNSVPRNGMQGDYVDLVDTLVALRLVRRKMLSSYFDLVKDEFDKITYAAVEVGLIKQFNRSSDVVKLDEEVEEIRQKIHRTLITPTERLAFPVLGKDERAYDLFVEMYEERSQDESATPEMKAFWQRPINEVFADMNGVSLLKGTPFPQGAVHIFAPDACIVPESTTALNLDPFVERIPQIAKLFHGTRDLVDNEVIEQVKSQILQHWPDLEVARQIAEYIDFWLGLNHQFNVLYVSEEVEQEKEYYEG